MCYNVRLGFPYSSHWQYALKVNDVLPAAFSFLNEQLLVTALLEFMQITVNIVPRQERLSVRIYFCYGYNAMHKQKVEARNVRIECILKRSCTMGSPSPTALKRFARLIQSSAVRAIIPEADWVRLTCRCF